jgi:hypothetical protein
MLFIPITGQTRQQKWDTVCTIARNNGFPLQTIHNLKSKIIRAQKDKKCSYTNTKKEINHIYIS